MAEIRDNADRKTVETMNEPLDREKAAFQWLINLPCVIRGEIQVDVRGPWPILIRGLAATTCTTKGEVVYFIIHHVDRPEWKRIKGQIRSDEQ